MIRCVIIDDEPLAQDVLEDHMSGIQDLKLVGKFNSASPAGNFLLHNKTDLLLLDIEMPGINGISFLKALAEPPLTIFTTAYRNYAFEGFELGVIDYLLKPISLPRFSAAIGKVRDFLSLRMHDTQLEPDGPSPESIFVKSGVKRIKLFFDQVTHIQGLKDYAIIHTPKEKIVIKGSVGMVQEMFPAALFTRVHKSFLVSTKAIMRIERNRIIIGNHQVPIGRNYREELERKIRG